MQYMITTARLFNAQRWKDVQIPTIEERTVKLMELAKLTTLMKDKI